MTRIANPKKSWLAYYSELLMVWPKRSGIPQDTEDAVQDAALSMLESDSVALHDHNHYFHRIAINRSISLYRAAQVRVAQNLDELPEEMHPATDSAEDICAASDMVQMMVEALESLPPACQQAFRMRQDGLNNGEIAHEMGVSRNMVERYMMRTIRHLQDQLHKHGH
jgi:RNA polymerase sigma factor (sigma-70 family)